MRLRRPMLDKNAGGRIGEGLLRRSGSAQPAAYRQTDAELLQVTRLGAVSRRVNAENRSELSTAHRSSS